jgi:hypothetical protein
MTKIYEIGIDMGDEGTITIAKFYDKYMAMAFMDGYKTANPNAKIFIDSVTSDFIKENQ